MTTLPTITNREYEDPEFAVFNGLPDGLPRHPNVGWMVRSPGTDRITDIWIWLTPEHPWYSIVVGNDRLLNYLQLPMTAQVREDKAWEITVTIPPESTDNYGERLLGALLTYFCHGVMDTDVESAP
jgi:hypothetical protein